MVTSNMAPAHPHATSVAVYPAFFYFFLSKEVSSPCQDHSIKGHKILILKKKIKDKGQLKIENLI